MRNFTISDTIFERNGTGIYISRNSTGEFASNTVSHCSFIECNQGIYGHSNYPNKSFKIKQS